MIKIQDTDLKVLERKGISVEQLEEQLRMLSEGFPYLRIKSAATPGNGIFRVNHEMLEKCVDIWNQYLSKGGAVMKMVPASGAASRMFKNLFGFLNGKGSKPSDEFMKTFFEHIEEFAFFAELNATCVRLYGKSVDTLIKEKEYKKIVAALLNPEGMNYGQLPKALLRFHKIMGSSRVPLEEHLAEAAQYASGHNGKARIHFTVSEDHMPLVKEKAEEARGVMEHAYGKEFDITFSVQKPSTDTVAVQLDGEPYRENGELFFRPGGHGALIENLNDLNADIIFIKNIDNVVPDRLRDSTILYKAVIGGVLVALKQKSDEYCRLIKKGKPTEENLAEMLHFLHDNLCITGDKAEEMTTEEKKEYIYSKLNRPFRVCGMVKNEGEPGGGPFLIYNPDGTASPQILESTQIDPDNKEAMKMLKESTHFNPVDLVCATTDWEGKKFNLPEYVDKATGFISQKSREGVEIKALELPGLWNGAMSKWNTVLIEVPAETFNPVKTVNDLLREAHQPTQSE
ncbi:MAG: DUF4301 family protein [Clostridium sp.]|nr:DUF4301 family protein [Prevotella sp.]MCM1428617.1 DUF4301 family protein [Clostridium sp.]MCM1475746.1 DUF4301 family protein [Muribaculaceae bacterium]